MVATAWSWLLVPRGMDKLDGMILMATMTAGITVRLADPLTDPEVAVMVVVPMARAVAVPDELMLAMVDSDEVHVADGVRSAELPSEKVAFAVNGSDSPAGKDDGFGLTVIVNNAGGWTVTAVLPFTPS
jgi:hypothetical protein